MDDFSLELWKAIKNLISEIQEVKVLLLNRGEVTGLRNYITVDEACKRLSVCRTTFDKMLRKGYFHFKRTGKGTKSKILIREYDINYFYQKKEIL